MSTRATYRVIDKTFSVERATTFYIHHDGYAEGAANYFHTLFSYRENLRGGLDSRFLRAISNSEITSSHEVHGDTEYRYDIVQTKDEIELICLKLVDWEFNCFKLIFRGNIYDFINKYSCEEPFYFVKASYRGYWTTLSQLETLAKEAKEKLESYSERFPNNKGNISSMKSTYEGYKKAIEEIRPSSEKRKR